MPNQLATTQQLLDPPDDDSAVIVRITRTHTIVTETIELRRPSVRKVLTQTAAGLWSEVER